MSVYQNNNHVTGKLPIIITSHDSCQSPITPNLSTNIIPTNIA